MLIEAMDLSAVVSADLEAVREILRGDISPAVIADLCQRVDGLVETARSLERAVDALDA